MSTFFRGSIQVNVDNDVPVDLCRENKFLRGFHNAKQLPEVHFTRDKVYARLYRGCDGAQRYYKGLKRLKHSNVLQPILFVQNRKRKAITFEPFEATLHSYIRKYKDILWNKKTEKEAGSFKPKMIGVIKTAYRTMSDIHNADLFHGKFTTKNIYMQIEDVENEHIKQSAKVKLLLPQFEMECRKHRHWSSKFLMARQVYDAGSFATFVREVVTLLESETDENSGGTTNGESDTMLESETDENSGGTTYGKPDTMLENETDENSGDTTDGEPGRVVKPAEVVDPVEYIMAGSVAKDPGRTVDEISDLINSVRQGMSMREIFERPALLSATKKIRLLSCIDDQFFTEKHEVEECANWTDTFDEVIWELGDFNHYLGPDRDFYYPDRPVNSFYDFLKFCRNIITHFNGLNERAKALLGGSAESALRHLESAYPLLMVDIVNYLSEYSLLGAFLSAPTP